MWKTSISRQTIIDRLRITRAVEFFYGHFRDQPTLERVAQHIGLSPWHFQRIFRRLVGVTPKQFLQHIILWQAKRMLRETNDTLTDIAYEMGLSGSSRLYDLFVNNEGMTPGEYKNRGRGLLVRYSFAPIASDIILIASTERGVCHLAFTDNNYLPALEDFKANLAYANFRSMTDIHQEEALSTIIGAYDWLTTESLNAKSGFLPIKVWQALLQLHCSSHKEDPDFGPVKIDDKPCCNGIFSWTLPEYFTWKISIYGKNTAEATY